MILTGTNTISNCGNNYYCLGDSDNTRIQCPVNSTTIDINTGDMNSNAYAIDQYIDKLGYYGSGRNTIQSCPIDYYCDEHGLITPKVCPIDTHSSIKLISIKQCV